MQVIIYKNPDNSVVIVTPAQTILQDYTIQEVAEKDVPAGIPYTIMDDSLIPADRTFRNAWELPTDTVFHGIGAESNEFTAPPTQKNPEGNPNANN